MTKFINWKLMNQRFMYLYWHNEIVFDDISGNDLIVKCIPEFDKHNLYR